MGSRSTGRKCVLGHEGVAVESMRVRVSFTTSLP